MSMPSFPPNGADMTREEALTMIIASIAMEELALSHILNAEGEKLQYVLGTLPGAKACACPRDVLAVNKSVTALVEAVTQNQMLLKNKLEKVLEFCPAPPPCKPEPAPCPPPCQPCGPPCPPPCPVPCPVPPPIPDEALTCEKSAIHLVGQQERISWDPNCRLPWKLRSCSGKNICWDARTPARVQLTPGRTYVVQYTLNVCTKSRTGGTGTILFKQSPCSGFSDADPLRFSTECSQARTLHHVAVLHPCMNIGCAVELSLMLDAKAPLCVERAVMDIVEFSI